MNFSGSTAATDTGNVSPTQLTAWKTLFDTAHRLSDTHITELYRADPQRFTRFSLAHDGLLADFSKQRIDDAALDALLRLAEEACVADAIHALFNGEPLNFTENRPALHMALRGSAEVPPADAHQLAHSTEQMRAFARALRAGKIYGASDKAIRRVVNLGIGGSDFGSRVAFEALHDPFSPTPIKVDFVASIDPCALNTVLATADPHSTLFIVSSKSFSTPETLANAQTARTWLRTELGQETDLAAHFAAVSNQRQRAIDFGISAERVLTTPEWVGGRYSVWSAVGLPLLIAIGEENFDAFLAGACSMDEHFRTAPAKSNLPILMALIGIWNTNFLDCDSLSVLPYAHGLTNFPAWLQQLDMESNGKRRRRDGSEVETNTAPIVFGLPGTIGQHTFHQLLYQGTRRIAADFIVPIRGEDPRSEALANSALAQSLAMMEGCSVEAARDKLLAAGQTPDEAQRLAPHLACPGNLPSTTLLLPGLTPHTLGQLFALYEHKIFIQGWIWGINSFDQYGVELGKEMARKMQSSDANPPHPATAGLLQAIGRIRETHREQT